MAAPGKSHRKKKVGKKADNRKAAEGKKKVVSNEQVITAAALQFLSLTFGS
jgi:hypothetical protein